MTGRVAQRMLAASASCGGHDGAADQHRGDSDRHDLGGRRAGTRQWRRRRRRPTSTTSTAGTAGATRRVGVRDGRLQLSLGDGDAVPLRRHVELGVARRGERHRHRARTDERRHRRGVRQRRASRALVGALDEHRVARRDATGKAPGRGVVAAGAVSGPVARRQLGRTNRSVGAGPGRAGTARKLGSETPRHADRRHRTGSPVHILDTQLDHHVDAQRQLDASQRAQRRIERIHGQATGTVQRHRGSRRVADSCRRTDAGRNEGRDESDRCSRDHAATGAEPTTGCAAAHPHPSSQSLTNGAGTVAAQPTRCRGAETRDESGPAPVPRFPRRSARTLITRRAVGARWRALRTASLTNAAAIPRVAFVPPGLCRHRR